MLLRKTGTKWNFGVQGQQQVLSDYNMPFVLIFSYFYSISFQYVILFFFTYKLLNLFHEPVCRLFE